MPVSLYQKDNEQLIDNLNNYNYICREQSIAFRLICFIYESIEIIYLIDEQKATIFVSEIKQFGINKQRKRNPLLRFVIRQNPN